jgi:hypothetical protein
MTRRLVSAICATALIAIISAGAAFGGEVTGNAKSLKVDGGGKWATGLHARSVCAFSGQEDLQFLDDAGNPLAETHKGSPGHAQSWGQIPKAVRDELTAAGFNPGKSCNPTIAPAE